MFRQIKSFVLVAITVGVVMGGSTPALGAPLAREFSVGQRYKNETAAEARCLIKYLYKWEIDNVGCPELPNCGYDQVKDYTVLTCTGGVVVDGGTATITFKGSPANREAWVLCAEFYSDVNVDGECINFIGEPIPVGSLGAPDAPRNVPTPGFKVSIKHRSREWDKKTNQPGDKLGPISGSGIYYAMWQEQIPAPDMTEVLWTCVDYQNDPPPSPAPPTECLNDDDCVDPVYKYCGRCYDEEHPEGECDAVDPVQHGITWRQHPKEWPANFTINTGEETDPFNLGDIGRNKRVLFRYYTDLVGQYQQSDYEVIQFRPRDIIPAVSQWGLVVIALVILAAGTVVIGRRRAVAARV